MIKVSSQGAVIETISIEGAQQFFDVNRYKYGPDHIANTLCPYSALLKSGADIYGLSDNKVAESCFCGYWEGSQCSAGVDRGKHIHYPRTFCMELLVSLIDLMEKAEEAFEIRVQGLSPEQVDNIVSLIDQAGVDPDEILSKAERIREALAVKYLGSLDSLVHIHGRAERVRDEIIEQILPQKTKEACRIEEEGPTNINPMYMAWVNGLINDRQAFGCELCPEMIGAVGLSLDTPTRP